MWERDFTSIFLNVTLFQKLELFFYVISNSSLWVTKLSLQIYKIDKININWILKSIFDHYLHHIENILFSETFVHK